jgi:iron complex transport system substrate-binding protein
LWRLSKNDKIGFNVVKTQNHNREENMKKILALILALCMVFALCACGTETAGTPAASPTGDTGTRGITDMVGRKVTVPTKVSKIVVLGNTPRMITYLGLAGEVVGYSGMKADEVTPVTAYAYVTKDQWKDVPIVGTDAGGNTDYYPEQIIAVKPDVIFCSSPAEMADNIQTQTNIPVVAVVQGTLFGDDYDQALELIGDICGVSDRAEAVVSYIHECLDDLAARTKDIADTDKPTVLSAAATFKGAHGIEGVRIKDPVMTAVNANNVAKDASGEGSAVIVDKEQILGWNPDIIFLDSGGVSLVKQDAKENPDYYTKLSAFQSGHVYQYPSSTSYYSNLEIPLANSYYVGSLLYPEQFSDINMKDKANEIFKFFLGVDDYMSVLEKSGAGYGEVTLGAN